MPTPVRLSIEMPGGEVQVQAFTERTTCIVGRAADCGARIDETSPSPLTSRHHCLVDMNPPDVRIRDLGSLNGTHVNGVEIGRRDPGQTPEEGARLRLREHDLADGDLVRIGQATIRIEVDRPKPRTTRRLCAWCLADVSGIADREGDLVCPACRAEPRRLAETLLERTDENAPGAVAGWALERELGRGGQGTVYLARDPRTGRCAAVKVLLPQVAVSDGARDQFLREIAITRQLGHPHVVEFLDGGYVGGVFFLASAYADGGDLAAECARHGGVLAVDDAVRIAAQVLDGLGFAHGAEVDDGRGGVVRGVVHRDVKPSNVLLAGSGAGRAAAIADFGIAKAFDNAGLSGLTRTGNVAGTVRFMARQQLIDYKFARPRVDVWSAAATTYWSLTGETPRTFGNGVDPLAVVLARAPEPIRHRAPAVPRAVAVAIDAALAGEGRSGPTAAELRTALLAAL